MAETASFNAICDTVSSLNSSNWDSWDSGAYQGSYNAGTARFGALLFEGLRDSIDWRMADISKITLQLTFGAAGGNSKSKTLYLYQGTQTQITGTGSAMKGDEVGAIDTITYGYDCTEAIEFDVSANSAEYEGLVSWLTDTESLTLVLYEDAESESGSYSDGYLCITGATLTVEYTESPFYVYKDGGYINAIPYMYINGEWVRIGAYYLLYMLTDGAGIVLTDENGNILTM